MQKLIIDSFAGGGGASTGIEMALGRSPDYAINHSPDALAMHEVNHPSTVHLDSNIWDVSPLEVTKGRPVGLFWASPDCKHFSKAKGGKPMDRNIRDLAWVVVRWAEEAQPDVIILENVEEFVTWGPLYEDGRPIVELRGHTFEQWTKRLKVAGYKVQWKELRACDYGAPTIRKRFFMIARRDGKPIVWPQRTHGDPKKPADAKLIAQGRLLPYRTAAEIIDWNLPCPSIFDTAEEIMANHGVRAVRPLADATMKRIARGVVRYVLEAAQPFVVKFQSGATGHPIDEPLATVTANSYIKRPGGAAPLGVVVPVVTAAQHGGSNRAADDPLHTITASPKDQNSIIVPSFVGCGGRAGQSAPRGGNEPLGTQTAKADGCVVAATMVQTGYGEREGQAPRALDIEKPLGTQVAGGAKHGVVAAFLAQHTAGSHPGQPARPANDPVSTVTGKGSQQSVVAAHLMNMRGSDRRHQPIDQPAPTATAGGNHAALIAPFLMKYYGTDQDPRLGDPMHTDTTKDRFGLVTVDIDGETYAIADIGMRMLTPRERFRAQGFPDSYIIDRRPDGSPLSATVQGSCCGNSVCPPLAEALVAANCADLAAEHDQEADVA
ncbi:DNA cytosine methyltransferase [Pelagibacterium sp. H642]|uniref:DNA cytosine methyltransferase n=1 Tax=Pelagibacterium sp. H642 TaxID=1881069 RepID=UPI0028154630|nr:DNA cytosine methyltransferase [Pelagibacterium sp. H642]WMT90121.1 DNA cytosine methyltransferase [Pelagibacterium sp. H642]